MKENRTETYPKLKEVVNRWKGEIVGDGSLPSNGFEINTAPANGDLFMAQISQLSKILRQNKAFVTNACGLHVHIDARDFNKRDMEKLIILYRSLEPFIYKLVAKSRKNSPYCRPCGESYFQAIHPPEKLSLSKKIDSAVYGGFRQVPEYVKKSHGGGDRYKALNLHSWFFRGTIECRLLNGTTSRIKITRWAMMWAEILDFVKNNKRSFVEKLAMKDPEFIMENILSKKVNSWIKNRLVELKEKVKEA